MSQPTIHVDINGTMLIPTRAGGSMAMLPNPGLVTALTEAASNGARLVFHSGGNLAHNTDELREKLADQPTLLAFLPVQSKQDTAKTNIAIAIDDEPVWNLKRDYNMNVRHHISAVGDNKLAIRDADYFRTRINDALNALRAEPAPVVPERPTQSFPSPATQTTQPQPAQKKNWLQRIFG